MIDNPKEEEKNISENRQSKKTFIFCYFVLAFLFLLGVKKMLQRGKKKTTLLTCLVANSIYMIRSNHLINNSTVYFVFLSTIWMKIYK